jgi:hypothetical protein
MDGTTDGCVRLREAANGGLAATAAALDTLYGVWRHRLPQLSRADLWQVRLEGQRELEPWRRTDV